MGRPLVKLHRSEWIEGSLRASTLEIRGTRTDVLAPALEVPIEEIFWEDASESKIDCRKFEDCSAPVCPLQQNTIDGGIWYPDEDICIAKRFQALPWVKKQKAIAKINAPNDRYFTVKMLEAIRQVRKGIEGINPDQPLEQAKKAEREWIIEKVGRRIIARQSPRPCRVTRAKKGNLVFVGKKPCQAKRGEK